MIQSSEKPQRIRELLDRNLQEVFGEGDAQRRCAAIEEMWAEDAVLYVPPGIVKGREAIDKFAGDLRATHPHYVYTPTAHRRYSTMRAASPGAPARGMNRRNIPAGT